MDDDKTIPFPDKQIDPPAHEAVTEPEHVPADEQLRAAEDRLLGKDVPRHDGKPEKGSGSKFAALHPAHKAHLAAIEHLIEVEKEHAAAEARLNAVHAKVQHATAQVEATEKASAEEQE